MVQIIRCTEQTGRLAAALLEIEEEAAAQKKACSG